ncbi:MAG TPA: ATP-binding protein, partial [Pedobacter sp.]|nr:ATP-binding protein [Pedobacter sp.]
MISKAANQFCKPAIEPRFEEVYLDEKVVLVVDIPKSDTKPHYALDENKKWWVYFRVKDKSVLASKIIVDVLKEGAKETGQFISYSAHEQKLLSYLAEHERITFKEYAKLVKSSHKKAQRVIVSLILAGVIIPHLSEKEEYFTADLRS